MKDEQTYTTVIKNQRQKTGVVLRDSTGQSLHLLAPGKEMTLESWNKDAIFSPFSEVVYKDKDLVETTPNPEYPKPKSRWCITVLNIDGHDMERRIIGGREVVLPKGLPRVFELSVDDPLAVYSKMEIKSVLERVPSENFPDYNEFKNILSDIFSDRPEVELQALVAELEKIATDI